MELPEGVKGIEVVSIRPGDVIVLKMDRFVSPEARDNLFGSLVRLFPDSQVEILEPGMELTVMRNDEQEAPATSAGVGE